ncbi:MAG: hypothetical protein WD069_17130 [Planctomycetales bacterium]
MSFCITVPNPVREKISSWGLDPQFELQVYQTLRSELLAIPYPAEPDVVAPVRFRRVRFTLDSPAGTPHVFFFAFNDWRFPGRRVIVSARYLV